MAYEGYELIRFVREDRVVVATIDNPPINLITPRLYAELARMSQEVEADPDALVFVLKSADQRVHTCARVMRDDDDTPRFKRVGQRADGARQGGDIDAAMLRGVHARGDDDGRRAIRLRLKGVMKRRGQEGEVGGQIDAHARPRDPRRIAPRRLVTGRHQRRAPQHAPPQLRVARLLQIADAAADDGGSAARRIRDTHHRVQRGKTFQRGVVARHLAAADHRQRPDRFQRRGDEPLAGQKLDPSFDELLPDPGVHRRPLPHEDVLYADHVPKAVRALEQQGEVADIMQVAG